MSKLSFVYGFVLCASPMAASIAADLAPPADAVLVGRDAPDFVLKGTDGKNLRLSEYRGQVVVVGFWARWAGDSRSALSALNRINTTYQRAGLVVLGVSVDEDARRARDYADAMKVQYPMLFDTSTEIGREYSLGRMPMTIMVDRSGVVRYANAGYKHGDERAYLAQIRQLLRE